MAILSVFFPIFDHSVMLFCPAECSDAHPCVGLSNHAHFRNFGMAFLTLFRVATGDNWNGIMKVSSTKAYFPEVHH